MSLPTPLQNLNESLDKRGVACAAGAWADPLLVFHTPLDPIGSRLLPVRAWQKANLRGRTTTGPTKLAGAGAPCPHHSARTPTLRVAYRAQHAAVAQRHACRWQRPWRCNAAAARLLARQPRARRSATRAYTQRFPHAALRCRRGERWLGRAAWRCSCRGPQYGGRFVSAVERGVGFETVSRIRGTKRGRHLAPRWHRGAPTEHGGQQVHAWAGALALGFSGAVAHADGASVEGAWHATAALALGAEPTAGRLCVRHRRSRVPWTSSNARPTSSKRSWRSENASSRCGPPSRQLLAHLTV